MDAENLLQLRRAGQRQFLLEIVVRVDQLDHVVRVVVRRVNLLFDSLVQVATVAERRRHVHERSQFAQALGEVYNHLSADEINLNGGAEEWVESYRGGHMVNNVDFVKKLLHESLFECEVRLAQLPDDRVNLCFVIIAQLLEHLKKIAKKWEKKFNLMNDDDDGSEFSCAMHSLHRKCNI